MRSFPFDCRVDRRDPETSVAAFIFTSIVSNRPAPRGTPARLAARRASVSIRTMPRPIRLWLERGGILFSRGHIYHLLANPIYAGQIAHKGQLFPGQHPALIDDEIWTAVRDRLAANAGDQSKHKVKSAEPSLLAGLLVDARGERPYAIPRSQERSTLSLLRLRLLDHRGRNGSRARLA